MKIFTVIVKSKNKKIEEKFFFIWNKIILNTLYSIEKNFKEKAKKKRITLLKSPHVNKKAQEHFETSIFEKQLTISNVKDFKCLILLKKLHFNLFFETNVILRYNI